MATTKATRKTSTKKPTTRAAAAKTAPAKSKTTVRTVSAKPAPVVTTAKPKRESKLPGNLANVMLAEVFGTFILALVALMTVADVTPLYIGLTFGLLFMTLGLVSGSHLNPAVSFGMWAVGKLKALMLPFYWLAQVLGAMAAVVVMHLVSGKNFGLDFSRFTEFSTPVFMVELIGTAVFLFGLVSVLNRVDLSPVGRALGVGLSLFAGLVVAGSLYAPVPAAAEADYLRQLQDVAARSGNEGQPDLAQLREVAVPSAMLVGGATLNPAIALAATESTNVNDIFERYGINDAAATEEDQPSYSRIGVEVIVATLLGAAIGAYATRLVNFQFSKRA